MIPIRQLYRLFFYHAPRESLPRLHERGLITSLDYRYLDNDVLQVLLAGYASDEDGARRLLDKYQARDINELRARLPKRENKWREKLRGIFVRIEGGYMENPHKREYEEFAQERTNKRRNDSW